MHILIDSVCTIQNTLHSLISRGYIQIYILVNRAAILSVFENTATRSETTKNNNQKEREENNVLYEHNIFSTLHFHFTGLLFTWALTDVVV